MTPKDFKESVKESKTQNQIYTYKDYQSWNDDQRYELINGIVYIMTPAPGRRHQKITGELYRQIATYLLKKECEVYIAPFDIRLPEDKEKDENILTVVQPDISVFCDINKLDKNGARGVPDLVIEVLSPSSRKIDKKLKKSLYEKHKVKEYWIVNPDDNTLEIYLLNDNQHYGKPSIYTNKDTVSVYIFTELSIDLNLVFA